MLVPSKGSCCCPSSYWSTRGLYSDHWLWQQLWGLCASNHHLSVTFFSVSVSCPSVLPVSAATGAWAMDIPPGSHYGINNQAFCSIVHLCVGFLDWCVQDIPSDLFIATPRSLPRAVVHNLCSDTSIWSLRFSHLECLFFFFNDKQFTDGVVKLVSSEL